MRMAIATAMLVLSIMGIAYAISTPGSQILLAYGGGLLIGMAVRQIIICATIQSMREFTDALNRGNGERRERHNTLRDWS